METEKIKHRISKTLLKALESGRYRNKTELSQSLNTTITSLTKYLKGTTYPQTDWLYYLCKELNVNPNWLIFGEDNPNLTVKTDTNNETISLTQELAQTQKLVIEYKDKEITELKKEIAMLKKSLATQNNNKPITTESITELSKKKENI